MASSLNPIRGKVGSTAGGGGYNPLSAGRKAYGMGGRPAPNVGKTSAAGQAGYTERDARRKAIMNRQGRA